MIIVSLHNHLPLLDPLSDAYFSPEIFSLILATRLLGGKLGFPMTWRLKSMAKCSLFLSVLSYITNQSLCCCRIHLHLICNFLIKWKPSVYCKLNHPLSTEAQCLMNTHPYTKNKSPSIFRHLSFVFTCAFAC